jgi:hypothetical protein
MRQNQIDPLLSELIAALNRAGFKTFSSCQGKTCLEDYEHNRHCEHSFISFENPSVPRRRKARARKLGLYIYNGDISVTALSGREATIDAVIQGNKAFPAKVRELFRL